MVFSFLRSGLKIGKKFAGNLKMSRVPSFGRMVQLHSQKIDGESGPYLEPRFKPMGFVADVNMFDDAKAVYEMAKKKGVDVDIASEAHADVASAPETDKY